MIQSDGNACNNDHDVLLDSELKPAAEMKNVACVNFLANLSATLNDTEEYSIIPRKKMGDEFTSVKCIVPGIIFKKHGSFQSEKNSLFGNDLVAEVDESFDPSQYQGRQRNSHFDKRVVLLANDVFILGPKRIHSVYMPPVSSPSLQTKYHSTSQLCASKLNSLLSSFKPNSQSNPWEDKMREDLEILELNKKKWIQKIRTGQYHFKYSKNGQPQRRFFKVNDQDEITWGSRENFVSGKESLCEVEYIIYGIESERFKNYNCNDGKPWLCFSLKLSARTIDIECSDEQSVCFSLL